MKERRKRQTGEVGKEDEGRKMKEGWKGGGRKDGRAEGRKEKR
jgi:hypothetical protein